MKSNRRQFLQTMAVGAAGLTAAKQLLASPPEISPVMFWDMSWGPAGYENVARNLVSQFNQQHAGVHVSYELEQWKDWPQLFDTAIAAGAQPDISTGGSYQAAQYYDMGHILELDDVVADLKSSGQDKDFFPGLLDRLVYKGHTVGLPWAIDIRVPLYRQDLFAKAGLKDPGTWNELRAAAKAMTSGGRYGFVFAGNYIEGMQALLALMINNGGGLFTGDGKLDVMNPRNVEAAILVSDMVKDGSVNPRSVDLTLSDAHKEFLSGGGAMMIGTSALEKEYPEQKNKIGLLAPIAGPHGDKGTLSWANNIMLYKSARNGDATKSFLKWWSANAKPLWTKANSDVLPARRSIASDAYFQDNPLTKRIFSEWVPLGKGTSARDVSMFAALNAIEGDQTLPALLKDLLRGKEVIASMQKAEAGLKK